MFKFVPSVMTIPLYYADNEDGTYSVDLDLIYEEMDKQIEELSKNKLIKTYTINEEND